MKKQTKAENKEGKRRNNGWKEGEHNRKSMYGSKYAPFVNNFVILGGY